MSHHLDETMSYQDSRGQEMQAFQGLRQAFIVPCESAKPCHPAKRPFDDPPPRQEHKALFGIGQLDDFQADALISGRLFGVSTRVALVNEGDFNHLAGCLLNRLRQLRHLGAVLLISGGHIQRQQVTQRIDRYVRFAPFASLGTVIARSLTAFRAGLQRPAVEDGRVPRR